MGAESALGCFSNDVLGQPQGCGQGETRRHAVDTGGFPVRPIRHEEGRHERESSRLDGEAATEAEDEAT